APRLPPIRRSPAPSRRRPRTCRPGFSNEEGEAMKLRFRAPAIIGRPMNDTGAPTAQDLATAIQANHNAIVEVLQRHGARLAELDQFASDLAQRLDARRAAYAGGGDPRAWGARVTASAEYQAFIADGCRGTR